MTESSLPRVSCLLPVYNGAAFIDEAVQSILDQTMTDFELVVVDDGSSDSTPAQLAAFAQRDSRVRIHTQPNGGIVSALNAGLALCRAPYVARMDADDISAMDRFAFQAEYLDSHEGCVLVGGFARSETLQDANQHRTTGGRHRRTDLACFPPRIAVSMHPLIMVRRAALEAIGGYRDDYRHAEDYDLFIRLAAFGTLDNPDKDVLFYRRHAGAVSVRNLGVQETNAVRAECDAIAAAGHGPIEDWLLQSYTRLRIFRRLQTIDIDQAGGHVVQSLRDLLQVSPRKLASRKYWRLRSIIAFTLLKFVRRRMVASYKRALSPS